MDGSPMSSSSQDSQYHHFIPRFILRSFGHIYQGANGAKRPRKGRKGSGEATLYPGEQAINIIDISKDVPVLAESPIRKTFGLQDMYRDFTKASDQHYLENKLSQLESDASAIFAKIRKAFDSGDQAVMMTRLERDTLRKFLFVMKYRGMGFHKRFTGSTDYVENDKETFMKYMNENGFETPRDVWFHCLKAILELKMDMDGKWKKELLTQIYRNDALWFIIHTEMMFMALCTPSSADQEFLLTENCFSVHEGPYEDLECPVSGERKAGIWTSYHEFTPISPRLMIVLRSFLIPNSAEDVNEEVRTFREEWYNKVASMHADPVAAKSILADLPIAKAANSYSSVNADGRLAYNDANWSRQSHDRFYFSFYKIGKRHVNMVNTILLDNAHQSSTICYYSASALIETLKHYLTLPVDEGFKKVNNETDDPKLKYLRKLESVLSTNLGSSTRLVYQCHAANFTQIDIEAFAKLALESISSNLASESYMQYLSKLPSGFHLVYEGLGGSRATFLEDMIGAKGMVERRTRVDVSTKGMDENIRQETRDKLIDEFYQLPSRRFWIYLKRIRVLLLSGNMSTTSDMDDTNDMTAILKRYWDGSEDTVAKAYSAITPTRLNVLMYTATMKQLFRIQHPNFHLSSKITLDQSGMTQLSLVKFFAFGQNSSICDCGIPALESRANFYKIMLQAAPDIQEYSNHFLTKEENLEMFVRILVRAEIDKLLDGKLPVPMIQELKGVLFEFVYPTHENIGFGS